MSKDLYFVVHSFSKGALGGVNRVVAETANELSKNPNNKIHILSFSKIDGTAYSISNNVTLHSLNMEKYSTQFFKGITKIFWFYIAFKNLMCFIKKRNNMNIAWNLTSPPLIMLFALFISKKYGKQIYCEHVSPLRKSNRIVYPLLRNFILKKGDKVISLNRKDQNYYLSKGINATLIHNGVKFSKPSADLNSKQIIFVGRFVDQKNPLEAIEIFNESKLFNKGYTLKFYGYGFYEKQMLEKIKLYGIEDHVKIITNESNPDLIYKDANCLIMTSNFEGLPMVLIEATSRGIPCIAYDCPEGPSEIIIDNVNGKLIKFGSKSQFISSLDLLEKNSFNINEIVNSVSNFRIENVIKEWESNIN